MKKLMTLSMLFMATVLLAQEEEVSKKKVSISGTVDAYYKTNLTSTDAANPAFNGGDGGSQNFGTSFANETGFALGMANIIASYEGEKTGVVADVVFGPRGNDAITGNNINQLYAYWNVSEGTTLTLGRFNTYLGYEVISPAANFNYSTSYLFSNGPFSHVGLKADFALSDDFSLMLAIMNATDIDSNTTGDYALGAQLGYSGQFLNFYYDSGIKLGFEIDYTGGFDLSDDFFLGINGAYADNDGNGFYGAALYPQLSTCDNFSIGLRGEYFNWMFDGPVDDTNVFAVTLTGSYTLENLIIKPELRLDSNSEEVYFDSDLEATKSLAAFTLAAIYSF
ncbi:outer membrane beta-barrel protein [Flavivirga amylovorans]|uniref:Outer membrane beta-barrel protein n=1 Tax=Flavivirga amylovorans TaxID=870486 RepID=A0ABT8WZT4_9FLAO|nr:outer membrane beta-barrel protein [Flavivirga amylovorans]MDO5987178.1 outer membrane beta-barrel protein [Flavivirga amylovorans]